MITVLVTIYITGFLTTFNALLHDAVQPSRVTTRTEEMVFAGVFSLAWPYTQSVVAYDTIEQLTKEK